MDVAQERKKPSAKKAKSNPTKKSPLTAANIEYFKKILLQKRRDLVGNVNEMKDETLKKSRLDACGDLSSMPIHMADIGTDNYEQEFALGLMNGERKLLREIDAALERIEEGTYGICEATHVPITIARLKAKPWARYCVQYTRKLEQGRVLGQEKSPHELQEFDNNDDLDE